MNDNLFFHVLDNTQSSDYPAGFRKSTADAVCESLKLAGILSEEERRILSMRILSFWGRVVFSVDIFVSAKFSQKTPMQYTRRQKILVEELLSCLSHYTSLPDVDLHLAQKILVSIAERCDCNHRIFVNKADIALLPIRNRMIISDRNRGETVRAIAQKYSLSSPQAYYIINGGYA